MAQNPDEMAWIAAAPRSPPARLDPFLMFGHYPTAQVGPGTRVALVPGTTLETYRERLGGGLFPDASASETVVLPIWAELEKGAATVAALAPAANLSHPWAIIVISVLAKMGLVTLGTPTS